MKLTLPSIFIFWALLVFGHGDLDARIKKLSEQIDKDPKNAELYMKRGDLYYQHEEFRKSIVDFEHARALSMRSEELSILLARSYFKANKQKIALEYIDELLEQNKNHVIANRWKGKILLSQLQYESAAQAFELVLEFSTKNIPENYLDLAGVFRRMKTRSSTYRACEVIKKGMSDINVLPIFLSKLVEYYSSMGDYETAVQYQTQLIEISKRKEYPYYNRARLHRRNGALALAKRDLNLSKDAILKLPQKVRQASATIRFLDEINKLQTFIDD